MRKREKERKAHVCFHEHTTEQAPLHPVTPTLVLSLLNFFPGLQPGAFSDNSPAETKGEALRRCCQVGRKQNTGINTIVCNLPAAGLPVWPRQRPSRGEGGRQGEREGAERRNRITLAGRERKRRG